MPLEDYLTPGEQVKFQSSTNVGYGGKAYTVVLTDKRILLYAKRGMVFKSDDVVTQRLDELQGVKYKEQGMIGKKGIIQVQGKTSMDLVGSAAEIKTLYQQMMAFL